MRRWYNILIIMLVLLALIVGKNIVNYQKSNDELLLGDIITLGDANGDGKVTSKDLLLVKKHVIGANTLTGNGKTAADANKDGSINSKDLLKIKRIVIGAEQTTTVNTGTSSQPTSTPTPTSTADSICESVKNNASIDYKSFVKLQKDKDDYYVIKAAHDCANKYNKPVVVTKGTYNIYKKNNDTITVQTNTNLSNSTIYIHDEFSDIYKYESDAPIYTIEPSTTNACVRKNNVPFNNDFKSLAPSSGKYYVRVEEKDGTKVYSRNKDDKDCNAKNLCQARSKSDVYRVYNGVVQDPMFWDYRNSTIKYTVCPIPDVELIFQNATFKTVARIECSKCGTTFMERGLMVNRSNTKISNIKHVFINSKGENITELKHKYTGFFKVNEVANVTIENSTVYALACRTSKGKSCSTYDIGIAEATNITLNGVKMYNEDQMKSTENWGVMGGGIYKNLTVINSELNRIDAHRNVHTVTIKNSTVGEKGITMTGTGDRNDNKLVLENVTWKYAEKLITLRADYGVTWNGTISIKNSKVSNVPTNTVSIVGVAGMKNNMGADFKADFKHPIYNPTKVTINGLKVSSSNVQAINVFNMNQTTFEKYYKTYQKSNYKSTNFSTSNITGNGSSKISKYAN